MARVGHARRVQASVASNDDVSATARPLLLDLFCGAGGAAMGYHRAGFDVIGVDAKPQPRYPFPFVQADALDFLRLLSWLELQQYAAIHASPPCQRFTCASVIRGREHPDLLTPTRELLRDTGLPWVIENVPGAPMRADLICCASQFPELRDEHEGLIRHRWFEFWDERAADAFGLREPCWHPRRAVSVFGHAVGGPKARALLQMPWATRDECSEAIPPPYTTLVARAFLAARPDLADREKGLSTADVA